MSPRTLPARLSSCVLPGLIALAGCTPRPGIQAMACPTIPHSRPASPPAPGPGAGPGNALAPGHWEWAGGGYDWIGPAWLPRPPHPHRPSAPILWQNGYWTADAGACVWTAGSFVS